MCDQIVKLNNPVYHCWVYGAVLYVVINLSGFCRSVVRGRACISKRYAVIWLVFSMFSVPTMAQSLPELRYKPAAPKQPVAFSHKQHVGQGLTCVGCHAMTAPGDYAGIAASGKCMACHISVKTDSLEIEKLTQFHNSDEEIPWEPVYLIPSYLFFSHTVHVKEVGASCRDCHGPVGERDIIGKERDISMAACMNCHRAKGGSLECDYCHDVR